ncbi:MAG: orotidine 5'-phosphate decarboxylase [Elusimicrobia bacterium RIFOXYB2_FULL_62_6]|nr:MAG: orotidine 5'-phosphate decarboxylase [Elusimicrobia bacterium RIFOXYB2_FULL_62_6]
MHKTRLIIALDVPDLKKARALLEKLDGLPVLYKVGSSLFTLAGPAAVDLAHEYGGKVFLDLKFHDIPNTVRNAVQSAAALGVYSLSLHLSGGAEMIKAAAELKKRPRLWGITVLTSFDEAGFARTGFGRGIDAAISALAELGAESGADGIVCSPREAAAVRKRFGRGLKIITPGIRPAGASDDQKRAMTPKEAALAGADFIVVGRPVLEARDPARAAQAILEEIA